MKWLLVLALVGGGVAHAEDDDGAEACHLRKASCKETSGEGGQLTITCVGAPSFVIAVQHDGEWKERVMAPMRRCVASVTIDQADYSVEIADGDVRTPVNVDRPVVDKPAVVAVLPPAPPVSRCSGNGLFAEPSLLTDFHGVFVRHELGAILRDCEGQRSRTFRFGMAFDLSGRYQSIGVETEMTLPIKNVVDLGIHAELGAANNNQGIYSIGVRARRDYAYLAIDYLSARNDTSTGRSLIAGVGFSGKPSLYIVAIEASALVFVGLLASAAAH